MQEKLYEKQGVTLNLIPITEYIVEFIKKISSRQLSNVKKNAYTMKILHDSLKDTIVATFKIDAKINTTSWLSNNTNVFYKCDIYKNRNDMDDHCYDSEAFISNPQKDKVTEEISATITIHEVMTDDWKNIYEMPYSYIGEKKIYDDNDLKAVVQHELTHCYLGYKKDIPEVEDAIEQIHNVRNMRGIGLPTYKLADCLYRYCIEDERNAFVQQHYIEYRIPGQYEYTSVWKNLNSDYKFFTEKFVPIKHSEKERQLNKQLYDKIYKYLKPIAEVLLSKKFKYISDSYEFTCELINEVIRKMAVFKRRLARASALRNDLREGVIHKSIYRTRY